MSEHRDEPDTSPEPLEIKEMSPPPPPPGEPTAPHAVEAPAEETPDRATMTEALPSQPVPGAGPAVPVEPRPVAPDEGRWPSNTKTAVVMLAVLLVLAVVGAVIGFVLAASDDDEVADDTTAQEFEAAVARADAAESELAELQEASAAQAEQLEALAAERDAALGERDEALGERDEALAEAAAEQERLTAELAEANEQIELLGELVGDVAGRFPIEVDPDLAVIDPAGIYSVSVNEITCSDLELCGSPPALPSSTLTRQADGALRLAIPDLLDVRLVSSGGSLFGFTDDSALVPPCGDTPRQSLVTVTLFGNTGNVDLDGSLTLADLGAGIFIDAPAVGDCPRGVVWYSALLTPQG